MGHDGVADRVNTPEQLRQRIACNASAAADFDRFVFGLLDVRRDDMVLDLGAGTGKQAVGAAALAKRVVALDVSREMLASLSDGVGARPLEPVVADMDDLGALEIGGPFTLAYAVYSLHYCRDAGAVIREVARRLGGERPRCVIVGPDVGNNARWFADLGHLYEVSAGALAVPRFGREVALPALRDVFGTVTTVVFRTEVRFRDLSSLMRYYDACGAYCRPDRRAAAIRYFGELFERNGVYGIEKVSLGLVGRG